MTERRATRRRCSDGRVRTSTVRGDVNIVNENAEKDYRSGCLWAGVCMVLVWGPLAVLGAYLGWF